MLTWSIAPISSTALFVDGLSIDPSTGVLSGKANFGGTAGFIASVTDSSSPPRSAKKSFTITASDVLQASAHQTSTITQFNDFSRINPDFQGGVFPFSFSLTGSLPPGLRLDGSKGQISGSATAVGTYSSTLVIQDSFSPPEIASEQLTIIVIPPQLSVANSLPPRILQNRPFNGRVVARGGVPPYHFALVSGSSLPPGLSPIDPNSGQTNGTPTTLGSFQFSVAVTDSSSPPQSATGTSVITVAHHWDAMTQSQAQLQLATDRSQRASAPTLTRRRMHPSPLTATTSNWLHSRARARLCICRPRPQANSTATRLTPS